MIVRITLNILLFLSILFFPWWVSLAIGLILLIRYTAYELLAYGFFADTVYGIPLPGLYNIQFLFTLVFFIALVASFYIKRKIIFYRTS